MRNSAGHSNGRPVGAYTRGICSLLETNGAMTRTALCARMPHIDPRHMHTYCARVVKLGLITVSGDGRSRQNVYAAVPNWRELADHPSLRADARNSFKIGLGTVAWSMGA